MENEVLCDGSSTEDPDTFGTRQCLIPMAVFRDSPYDLVYQDLVQAKVIATNGRGSSQASPANVSGAKIEVEPSQITDLVQTTETSYQKLVIDWSAPTNGGSPILSYVIFWDAGLGGDFAELVGQPS